MMLFRRSKWTKQFLEAVAELGRVPEPELGEVRAAAAQCPSAMPGKSELTCDLFCTTCQPLVFVHK